MKICFTENDGGLANYLRKILEKNSWSTDMGKHILEAYEKQRKLCKEEKQLLHVLLLVSREILESIQSLQ